MGLSSLLGSVALSAAQPVAAGAHNAGADPGLSPIFHVGPAGCRGGTAPLHHGWTNDPNGRQFFQREGFEVSHEAASGFISPSFR